jgi:hypothetical protein
MNRKRFWIGGLTLAGFLVLGAIYVASLPGAESAIAAPYVCNYYADAKYKKVVGGTGIGCCGEVINWGVVTPYKKCQKLYCLDVLCPF